MRNNIDIDPNYYYQQGMQQPYPPYQEYKPGIFESAAIGIRTSLKIIKYIFVFWLFFTAYGILITEGDSWNQKALNYFDQQRVQYQQQLQNEQLQQEE